jgi:RND family efflux transporter MFP subunit
MIPQHQEPEDTGFHFPVAARTSPTKVIIVIVFVVGGAFAFGILRGRGATMNAAVCGTNGDARTVRVEVIKPKAVSGELAIELPGVIKALEETQIYPRATGYVREWFVDVGDNVTAGQLLAEIEVPELDAQLTQSLAQVAVARASVNQAIALRDFAKLNAARYGALAGQELVAKSQADQTAAQAANDEANVAATNANVAAQAANVHRLRASQAFAKVTAPFAGKITRRYIDRGSLVSDSKSAAMFDLVAIGSVRVYIEVPQTVAPSVRAGADAKVTVREYGSRVFTGKVTRSAGALDPGLHTMTTEIQVPNPDGALMPGMYVRAALTVTASHHVVEIPATALYSDAAGLRVAKVDKEHKIHLVPITIERDTGAMLQISIGLTGDEKIVKIAVPTLVEGEIVEIAEPPPSAAGSGAGGGAGSAARSGAPNK